MFINVETRIKTRICRAKDGKIVKESPWRKNLVMDSGLNSLAKKNTGTSNTTSLAGCFTYCLLGSGTNANSFASGAITFTQAGTTVTASGGFFTAAMVGAIFKYGTGTGGAEYYITAFTSSTQVTVDTSATVSVGTVATVWMVQQTAMQSPGLNSNTYQTTAGSNSTTFAATSITYQRTFTFPVQGAPYTVNEIGYSSVNTGNIIGRIVLPSSDVVGTAFFYVVVIQIQFTYTPNTPTVVANVGTNINTAGNAMVEWWDISNVLTNGTNQVGTVLDSGNPPSCKVSTANYTQSATGIQGSPGPFTWNPTFVALGNTFNWTNQSARGVMQLTVSFSVTTSGQTIYGIGLDNGNLRPAFDVKFTTPQTLPVGTFSGNFVFQITFGRTLTN